MADIKLKNTANTEFSISHNGTRGAKAVTSDQIVVAVETINDFPANAETGDTVIVKDMNRGGTFIYDATQSAVNNGGTVFDGWVRQYSGAVNVKWFGDGGNTIQMAIDVAGEYEEIILQPQMHIGNTIIPKNGQKFHGSSLIADTTTYITMFDISGLKDIEFNQIIFSTLGSGAGHYIYGSSSFNITIEKCSFLRGAASIRFTGNYLDWSNKINIKDNNFIGHGYGSFASFDYSSNINIYDNTIENASEGIDLNNIIENATIIKNTFKNLVQNHIDVNSSHYVTIEDNIFIDESKCTSRLLLVSDYTGGTFPTGIDTKFKHSDKIIINRNRIETDSYIGDYILLINHGATFVPTIVQDVTVSNNIITNNDTAVSPSKILIGTAVLHSISVNVTNNIINNFKLAIFGGDNSIIEKNTFNNNGADIMGYVLDVRGSDTTIVSKNIVNGYSPPSTNSSTSCIFYFKACSNCIISNNLVKMVSVGYCIIGTDGGGTNRYLYNYYNIATTNSTGVRSNAGDVVVKV